MNRPWVILWLMLVISILGCSSNDDQVTGELIANTVSTLTIVVENETGGALGDAAIYQNEEYKGTTSKYGRGKGTKTIILKEGENWISVEKEGYVGTKPTSILSSLEGPQYITFVLKEIKVDYLVNVESKEGEKVESARVSLYPNNETTPVKVVLTDEQGEALFEWLNDGNYTVRVVKEEYDKETFEQTVNLSHDGPELEVNVILYPLPELKVIVKDKNGENLWNAEVSLYEKEEYNSPGAWPISVQSTFEGNTVIFKQVQLDQDYTIMVKKEGYSAQVLSKTLTSDDQKLEVVMIELE